MRNNVLIMDTSFLCCLLQVPGKETCGKLTDIWDNKRVNEYIDNKIDEGATLVLPLASIIETGNHIAQAPASIYDLAKRLSEIIKNAADEVSPWAAFTAQGQLWERDGLIKLANDWPTLATQRLTIGDASIKMVADYYSRIGFSVEILTGDEGLKAHEPNFVVNTPRRRR